MTNGGACVTFVVDCVWKCDHACGDFVQGVALAVYVSYGISRLISLTDVINLLGLLRRKIGKALGKTIKVSAVGVYSFDGANEQQKQVGEGSTANDICGLCTRLDIVLYGA